MALKHRGEEFQIGHLNLNVCGFFGGGLLVSPCSPSTCPQNWFAAFTVICALKKKKHHLAIRGSIGQLLLFFSFSHTSCSPPPPAPPHATLELSAFRTEEEGDGFSAPGSQWLPPNFPAPTVRQTLWRGRLLFVVGVRRQIRGGLRRDSTRWIVRQSRGVTTDIFTRRASQKKKRARKKRTAPESTSQLQRASLKSGI